MAFAAAMPMEFDHKKLALRAKYRESLEARLGKAMQDWYMILKGFDPEGQRKQHELSHYLQTSYGLPLWEANVVVYYYLYPDRRYEIGETRGEKISTLHRAEPEEEEAL